MAPRLSLFGVIHFDRPSKVSGELGDYAGDADGVFVEWPEEFPDRRTLARVAARQPLALVGAFALSLLYAPLYLLATRQYRPAEAVAVDRLDEPAHDVDLHPLVPIADLGVGWTLASWGALVAALVVDPVSTAAAVAVVLVAGAILGARSRYGRGFPTALVGTVLLVATVAVLPWLGVVGSSLVAVGAGTFTFAAGRTVEARNEHMLDRIVELSEAHGCEEVVLVTGKGHLAGLVASARERGVPVDRAHTSRFLRSGLVDAEPGVAGSRTGGPASVRRRFGAGAGDAVVVGSIVVAVVGLTPASLHPFLALALWFLAVPVAYFAAFEATLGWTPGKQLLGVRVTDGEGAPAGAGAALVRNALRPVDALLFFLVAVGDERNRRLGDRAAGTEVRRL